jgi:hypothetical protein
MRGKWRFLLLVSAVVVVACTKEWSGRRQAASRVKPGNEGDRTVYASEWTTLQHWQKDKKGFYAEQPVAHQSGNGKVLLFARKLWAADQNEEDTTDIPLQLPLQFLPYTDQPGLTETWQYELGTDKLRVNLRVEGADEAAPREVAVRYVIVPQPMWDELATSVPDAAELPYEDLVAKLDIKP